MRINSESLRDLKLLKHYRLIRKWACKKYKITDADLELMFYLDALDLFNKDDFKKGVYYYSWDNRRWNKLLKKDWIIVWRKRNRTTQKYNIYKISFKGKQLISRVYRIMLGLDDIPMSERRNKLVAGETYTDKVMYQAMYNVNKDKQR